MRFSAWILAYRGCDAEEYDRVLVGEQEVRISQNPWDWLGHGAYFWENSVQRAQEWAEFLASRPKKPIKKPAVIGAIIDPGNCLDLADRECLDLVKAAYHDFAEMMRVSETLLPANEKAHSGDHDFTKRHLDCAVLNFLHQSREKNRLSPFDTVRSPFLEGSSLFAGSRLSAQTHMQWSVRNPRKSVLGYFRPRPVN
jgi:hypothetical protein